MKKIFALLVVTFFSCSTVSLIENWKNPDTQVFYANKVLIVGMTQNIKARNSFENKLQREFEKRNVEAIRSLDVFDVSFTDTRKTEEELDSLEQSLLAEGFDAILLTKVTGMENRQSLLNTISHWDQYEGRFNQDYLENQQIYYDEGYYDTFKVYHAQTTLYCICGGKERARIWQGSIDITDPRDIEKSVDDYVQLVITALEEQDLIFINESTTDLTGIQ